MNGKYYFGWSGAMPVEGRGVGQSGNKTTSVPKFGLGLGAELGNNIFSLRVIGNF